MRLKRERSAIWKSKVKLIEKMQLFKYLRFIVNNKGTDVVHCKKVINAGRESEL